MADTHAHSFFLFFFPPSVPPQRNSPLLSVFNNIKSWTRDSFRHRRLRQTQTAHEMRWRPAVNLPNHAKPLLSPPFGPFGPLVHWSIGPLVQTSSSLVCTVSQSTRQVKGPFINSFVTV